MHGDAVAAHMKDTRTGVAKGAFWAFYCAAQAAAYTKNNIKSAWRATGIVPYNPNAVLAGLTGFETPRVVSAESVGEVASSKGLLNRTKSGKKKKERVKGTRMIQGVPIARSLGVGGGVLVRAPRARTDNFKKFLEAKKGDNQGDKKPDPSRVSICQSYLLKATHWQPMLSKKWFLDSSVTDHMSKNKDALSDFKPFARPKDIQLEDNSIIKSYGSGMIRLGKITLKNVLYAPKLWCTQVAVHASAGARKCWESF